MPGEFLVSAHGIQGDLFLFSDRVRTSRKGFGALLQHGLVGEKDIFIKDISSVQFKPAGTFTNGYIQFAFLGGTEAKRGILEATQDENTVMFSPKHQPEFTQIRDKIQLMQQSKAAPGHSSLDDFEKLAGLRDKGIISPAEFEAKKKQLLGL